MDGMVEVRIRSEDHSPEHGIPAFAVPWDQLEEARRTFQNWGVYDTETGEVLGHAFGQIVMERDGKGGRVWFDVAATNDE